MRETILVIGSGYATFREYALSGLSDSFDVVMILRTEPDWQRSWITGHRVADLSDPLAVLAAARDLASEHPVSGVLTWEEKLLETAAGVGDALGLPGLPSSAAKVARDKFLQRSVFELQDVPSARFRVVTRVDEAMAFAETVGYPVVVKPRGQAASVGVQIVRSGEALEAALAFATASEVPGRDGGVLVEEFLAGQEISVDCWCVGGQVEPYAVALKQIGFAPYCEEVGHVVGDVLEPSLLKEVAEVVRAANRAVGVTNALTHTEVMLTEDGPRIVEVNARLGGELIPWLAEMMRPGLNVGTMLGDVTVGRAPDVLPEIDTMHGVRFLYPGADLVLDSLVLPEEITVADWLVASRQVRERGETLRLPPRAFLDRAGYAVVTGADRTQVEARMAAVADACRVVGAPAA